MVSRASPPSYLEGKLPGDAMADKFHIAGWPVLYFQSQFHLVSKSDAILAKGYTVTNHRSYVEMFTRIWEKLGHLGAKRNDQRK